MANCQSWRKRDWKQFSLLTLMFIQFSTADHLKCIFWPKLFVSYIRLALIRFLCVYVTKKCRGGGWWSISTCIMFWGVGEGLVVLSWVDRVASLLLLQCQVEKTLAHWRHILKINIRFFSNFTDSDRVLCCGTITRETVSFLLSLYSFMLFQNGINFSSISKTIRSFIYPPIIHRNCNKWSLCVTFILRTWINS